LINDYRPDVQGDTRNSVGFSALRLEVKMINYGLAFVIGWLAIAIWQITHGHTIRPWDVRLLIWGGAFMVLNWIATLG
jgi:hypothetical protein